MTVPSPFDFRQPPPGTHERQLAQWLQQSCRRLASHAARLLPFSLAARAGEIDTGMLAPLGDALPEESLCWPLTPQAHPQDAFYLVLPRPLLLALIAGLLRETPTAWPDDRDLTDLETALVDYLVKELFLASLEQAWLEPPFTLELGTMVPVRNVLRRQGTKLGWRAKVILTAPWGEQNFWLCIPRQGLWEQWGASAQTAPPPPAPHPQWRSSLESLVQQFPIEVAVVLGEAETTMKRLAELKVGDVVVLRQPVDQPLQGHIGGVPKFRAWPGMRGGRTAILIEAITPNTPTS